MVVHEIRWFSGSFRGFWNIGEHGVLVVQGLHRASENAFILEEVLPLEHIYPIYMIYDFYYPHLLSILIYILCTRCLHHFSSVDSAVLTLFVFGGSVLKPLKDTTGRRTHIPLQLLSPN